MIRRKLSAEELRELRAIAEYQFGVSGEVLIPGDVVAVVSPSTNRIRVLERDGRKYLSIRAGDYRFNLHISSAKILHAHLSPPYLRVYVKNEYSPFVMRGGNVFAKHVLLADPRIRPGDEVLVVDENDALIATGRAILAGHEIVYYKRGEAVRVREGVLKGGQ